MTVNNEQTPIPHSKPCCLNSYLVVEKRLYVSHNLGFLRGLKPRHMWSFYIVVYMENLWSININSPVLVRLTHALHVFCHSHKQCPWCFSSWSAGETVIQIVHCLWYQGIQLWQEQWDCNCMGTMHSSHWGFGFYILKGKGLAVVEHVNYYT